MTLEKCPSADPGYTTNQYLKQIHVCDARHDNARVSNSGLVEVFLLIGRESCLSFCNQSQRDDKGYSNTKWEQQ